MNAVGRERADASITRALARISKREDVEIINVTAIPCAKVVQITQMALRPAENVVSIEIHVH